MRIKKVEDFRVDGGWQTLSFLKITACDGRVGWSEFNEGFSGGLAAVVRAMAATILGHDPREVASIVGGLRARSRTTAGGLSAQAIAAIENACLDLKAKAMGVPVYELFGGRHRDTAPAYWSHCGLYRLRRPELFEARGMCVPSCLDDMAKVAAEVPARGFTALKTNLLGFGAAGAPDAHMPGFGRGPHHPALNADRAVLADADALVRQLRKGAPGVGVMMDLNFNFKPAGVRRVAAALDQLDLEWLEVDGLDAQSLAEIRRGCRTPIASLEAVYGASAMRPYLEARAVDVAIIDPMWNGFSESVRMAALADAHHVNVASHFYSGTLALAISAQFCAVVPNLRIMEIDGDRVAWHDELFEGRVEVVDGNVLVPQRPGWGVEVNERALEKYRVD